VFGDAPGGEAALDVADLIGDPQQYLGVEITLRGIILAQCSRGCTFTLDDSTGELRIEMVDDAVLDPLSAGSVGRSVEVRGTFALRPDPVLILSAAGSWRYLP
jgi:hypothetical protein